MTLNVTKTAPPHLNRSEKSEQNKYIALRLSSQVVNDLLSCTISEIGKQ